MRFFPLCAVLAALPGAALAADSSPQDAPLDALVRAYPEALAGHEGNVLIWRDGTRMDAGPLHPDASEESLVRDGSILDQLHQAYRAGPATRPPGVDEDPGRIRNRAFFDKLYGDCTKGEVASHLVPVVWLPKTDGRTLQMTSINGVADRLAEVSRELDQLPDDLKHYLTPPGGSYNCRVVAATGQPSMHGHGAAIDINVKYSTLWSWHGRAGLGEDETRSIPPEIVAIFEKHGFIWGGKWYHYDTMHFEYRPELLTPTR